MKKLAFLLLSCLLLCACTYPQESKKTSASSTSTSTSSSTHTSGTSHTPGDDIHISMPDGAINAVEAWGIKSGNGFATENSVELVRRFFEIENGTTVYFPAGTYEINAPIYLTNKKNIRIVGDFATFIRSGVTNTAAEQTPSSDPAWPNEFRPYTASSSMFVVSECESITFEGLVLKYAIPTSISGRITDISGGSISVEVTDGANITGQEYVTVVNSFSQNGVANKTFEQYAETHFPVQKLADNVLRVSGLSAYGVSKMAIGSRVCLRLSTASNYVFDIQKTFGTVFENITIRNSLNGGIIMTSRCGNALLKNVCVKPENDESLMSTNADILHIAALQGTLTVEDCHFEKPGDDCINVHDMAYKVDSVTGDRATVSAPRFSFSQSWAKQGDIIEFFDSETFASLGTATVTSTNNKQYYFDSIPEGVKAGTVISNCTMHPSVTIRNTTVENNRARGFLLQTNNVTVENCTFKNTALAAILIAPDLDYWYEMSPARNVTLKDNVFENCGAHAPGVIQFSTDHDDYQKRYESYIHSDISVTGNTFISNNNYKPALYGICVQNLTFTGNRFDNFAGKCASLTFCRNVTVDEAIVRKCTFVDVTEIN